MAKKSNALIIDVREPYEFTEGHVAGAINIPLGSIASGIQNVAPNKEAKIILYCRSGNRSGQAVQLLSNMGYTNAQNGINIANVNHIV